MDSSNVPGHLLIISEYQYMLVSLFCSVVVQPKSSLSEFLLLWVEVSGLSCTISCTKVEPPSSYSFITLSSATMEPVDLILLYILHYQMQIKFLLRLWLLLLTPLIISECSDFLKASTLLYQ